MASGDAESFDTMPLHYYPDELQIPPANEHAADRPTVSQAQSKQEISVLPMNGHASNVACVV